MRYAIWNNKGGVGKTFLTFVIACDYAVCHPDRKVVMLDLCPQANLSEIVLGGNGKGAENLSNLIESHKTIGGYFDARISSPQQRTGTETDFQINDLKKYTPICQTMLHSLQVILLLKSKHKLSIKLVLKHFLQTVGLMFIGG